MRSLLFALLLVCPTAAAATLSADLAFEDGLHIRGPLTLRADEGALDLSGGVGGLRISWARATGTLVTESRLYAGPSGMVNVFMGDAPRENDALSFGAASLADLACAAPCSVLAVAAGGTLLLEGIADGEMARAGEPHRWGQGAIVAGDFRYETRDEWFAAEASSLGNGAAGSSGRILLYLQNVTGTVVGATGAEALQTQGGSQPERGPAGVETGRREVYRHAVLALDDARIVTASGAHATLYAPAPVFQTTGTFSAPSATGTLVVDGVARTIDHDRLEIEGDVAARPRSAEGLPLAPGAPPLEAALSGEASRIVVGGAPIVSRASAAPALVAVGALALLLLAIPFYTRLHGGNILRNPNRARIYERLRERPGRTVPELMRETGMGEIVVRHHLRMLEGQKLVSLRTSGRVRAWFPADAAMRESVQVQLALKTDTRRAIADTLARSAALRSQKELANSLGISQRLVSHHLGRLESEGLVLGEGSMPRRYGATPRLASYLSEQAASA